MITDCLNRCDLYRKLGQSWEKAFDFLLRCAQSMPETGHYAIDGDEVYAIVQRYETAPAQQLRWEAHREYIDVQCVFAGEESIGYAPAKNGVAPTAYSAEKDCYFLGDAKDSVMIPLEAGQFAIFMPEEIHKPHCVLHQPCDIRKVVVKIRRS